MLASALTTRFISLAALAALGGLGAAGLRCSARSASHKPRAPEARLAPIPVGLGPVELRATNLGHSRILLDEATTARLRASAERRTPAFTRLARRCETLLGKPIAGGYQAFEWSNAVANLALCWRVTGDERFSAGAVAYLQALLDDRFKVGDGRGGDSVVHHDSGYGIRTFGAYSALGYDWLRTAPNLSPAIKERLVERLDGWLRWYGEKGYLRDNPISNYFWGYVTTLSFAGLALQGEAPQANAWLERSRDLLSKRILPTFRAKLHGGYWPEGAQYGEYTELEIALVAQAYNSAAKLDLVRQLPWLADSVTYHVHALAPDKATVYDGGTWTSHPARPSGLGMSAAGFVLDGVDDARASEARWLVRHALPRIEEDQAWIAFLTERPDAPEKDPRRRQQTSFHAPGGSLTFMRSDWSSSAVWASFEAGPRLAEDHQHKDEGHFGLWRGGDALLVDAGGGEGDATINHNTILVDDGGRCMTYTPNQGVFGTNVSTTRFADDGQVVAVAGDIADAYAPVCARDEGCSDRALSKLVRTLVFVRPSLLVVHDAIELTKGSDGTIWAAHLSTNPTVTGNSIDAVVGASRVHVQNLFPEGARIEVRKEPTPSGPGPHRKNQVWGPTWRVEIDAPRAGEQRTFLNYITATDAQGNAPKAQRLLGRGLNGARGALGAKQHAIVFASDENGGEVALGHGPSWTVVAGLGPSKRYRVQVLPDKNCTLEVRPANDGNASANAGGFIKFATTECEAK